MGEIQLTGLKPNATYIVSVKTKNGSSESQPSEVLTFTTPTSIVDTINKNTTIKLLGGSIYAGSVTGPGVLFNQNGLIGLFSPTACSFYLDSTTGDAYFAGVLTASVGQIGGFSIKSNSLSATNIVLSSTDGFILGSASQFTVNQNGDLRATSASITGNIVANSGSFLGAITASVGRIGGFTLQSNSLSAQNIVISSTTGLNYGPNKFIVDQNGNASALSLYASSGQIAGDFQVTGTVFVGAKRGTGNNGIQIGASGIYGYNATSDRFFLPTDALQDPILNRFSIIESKYTGSGACAIFVVGSPANGQSNITINGDKVTAPGKPAAIFSVIGDGVSSSATSSATNRGFYFDDQGRFRIAADANNYISGSSGNLFLSGTIVANSGSIGNWIISSSGLYNGSVGFFASSTYNSNEVAIFAGSAINNRSTAPFRVTYNGNLVAQNASITGNIIANSGSFNGGLYASVGRIAGFNISSRDLSTTETAVGFAGVQNPYVQISTGYNTLLGLPTPYWTTGQKYTSASVGSILLTASYRGVSDGQALIIDPFGISWSEGIAQWYLNSEALVYDGGTDQYRILGANTISPPATVTLRIGGTTNLASNSQQFGGLTIVSASVAANTVLLRPHTASGVAITTSDLYYDQSASAWKNEPAFYIYNKTNTSFTESNEGVYARDYISIIRNNDIPLGVHRYNSAGAGAVELIRLSVNTQDRGGITADAIGNPAFRNPSDYRLKENIEDYFDSIEIIKKTKLRKFNLKNDPEKIPQVGFIAHEFAEANSDWVMGEKDEIDENGNPIYQSILTTALIPYLTGALKDAILKIEELEQRIATLENK